MEKIEEAKSEKYFRKQNDPDLPNLNTSEPKTAQKLPYYNHWEDKLK